MTRKIIIDTDPAMGTKGGDPEDCFAIMLAMNSPELEILGITTVQGNVPVERGFSNAKYLVKKFDKDIPVHTGTPGTYDLERNEKRKSLGITWQHFLVLFYSFNGHSRNSFSFWRNYYKSN